MLDYLFENFFVFLIFFCTIFVLCFIYRFVVRLFWRFLCVTVASLLLGATAAPRLAGAALAALLPFTAIAAQSATPDWVAQSNAHAQVLLKVLADFNPETAGQLGVEGYDDKVIDLKPKYHQRSQKATAAAVAELQARLAKEEHPAVRQDLQILIKAARDNMESAQLNHDLALPYIAVDRRVFGGIKGRLDPRISPERQALAVTR